MIAALAFGAATLYLSVSFVALWPEPRPAVAMPRVEIAIALPAQPAPLAKRTKPAKAPSAAPVAPVAPAVRPARASRQATPRRHYLFGKPDATPAPETLARRAKAVAGVIHVSSVEDLTKKMSDLDYRLSDVRRGAAQVPRLTIAALPRDLRQLQSVRSRKNLFVRAILPLILQANETVMAERRRLVAVLAQKSPDADDRAWLTELALRYDVKSDDRAELLRRVDIVPPSLALAQAAEESGWGTSRFAQEANAVFGQWTFRSDIGVVPSRRDDGKRHKIRAFGGLRASVLAYLRNLNIHWAYDGFRKLRADLRARQGWLSGYDLTPSLERYSERGKAYIKTIRTIMRVNGFAAYDRARLEGADRLGI
ncbi:MAG TPA: glucosaminidase domain-containing protein [Alphaproteobacteria bacterium]|jgi:Bax protein|nr:glucosaminidase domain-containing protein [Alphaproteobacteria bacterium]MDP7163832.1 glucosaminidase domain-containing protein [Alphaproteobacteria bacterium]MDP7429598.1 glucosaminidase domain-containing protein [Alphaproteobacteria bacterium]HJM50361.1 glucosaminidase domain-containing protein [Alphaproteobacteria bacterium]